MKNKILCLLILAGLSFQAQADPILSFDPDFQTTSVGSSVFVDLRISDLGELILTGFDIDVLYDDTILQFDGFTFGTGLDVFLFEDNLQFVTDWGGGAINVFELSFDFDEDLMAFQPNDFVLGTFEFTALMLGTSSLDVGFMLLAGAYDASGFATEVSANVEAGSIQVIQVPEPATWMLLMGGLFGMGLARKKGVARAS